MIRILFVTYGGGHVNMIIPIVKKLREEKKCTIDILALTTAGKMLEREGIPYIGFKHLLKDSDMRSITIGKELLSTLQGGSNNVPVEETIAYLGLSYTDLEERYGIEEARKMYDESGRYAFFPITILERYLQESKPDLVVATNSPRAEQAALTAAGNLGIPSICIVDLFGIVESQWIGQKGYASKICVLNSRVKKMFLELGRSDDEVVITGNPAFDSLGDPIYQVHAKQLRLEKAWHDKKVILWASQPEPGNEELPRRIEEKLFEIVRENPHIQLILRFHPNEQVFYDQLPERTYISNQDDKLAILLHASDAVVTMTSTVGLEGALIGKPVITVDKSIYTRDVPFSKMGISKGVEELDDLSRVVEEVLNQPVSIGEEYTNVGIATDNICRLIINMLNETKH